MAGYRLSVKRSAAKEIEAIGQRRDRQKVVDRIAALAEEPRPQGCEKLAGHLDRYRVRVGSYRVVYSVDDESQAICVVKVGHRKDAYRGAC
ncbi:MAG: type II toxin-antitoxin system RelE/ParE family toxin [Thermoanaerobaculaceae bacterium]